MKYDFTTLIERKGRDAIAFDGVGGGGMAPLGPKEGFDLIPMWIADMNFATCPTVPKAIIQRVEHPLYGYFDPTEEYYASIIRWQKKRNGVTGLEREHIGYENGVLGGVVSALGVLCSRGDKVLVHSPTYIGFTKSLTSNGYHIVHSPLVKDAQGVWRAHRDGSFVLTRPMLASILRAGVIFCRDDQDSIARAEYIILCSGV